MWNNDRGKNGQGITMSGHIKGTLRAVVSGYPKRNHRKEKVRGRPAYNYRRRIVSEEKGDQKAHRRLAHSDF